MAERSDIRINWALSPRIITVAAPSTELTMQDLYDTLRSLEDDLGALDDASIASGAGKEELGGSVLVGITITLQNAQVAFEARTGVVSSGTVTSGSTFTLIDLGATFVSDGVQPGYLVCNTTDGSKCTVLRVDGETQLTVTQPTGGAHNYFEVGDAYDAYTVEQCNLVGGNLVAVDDVGDPLTPVFPTFGVQVVRTSSSSATLQELEEIQYGTYQNAVWYSQMSLNSGTDYPMGTPEHPVNNLADALVIANNNGFMVIQIYGLLNLASGDDVSDFTIRGRSVFTSFVAAQSGSLTNNTRFYDCTILGYMLGQVQAYNCGISMLNQFNGVIYDSVLTNTIGIGSGATYLLGVYNSAVPGQSIIIDFGGRNASLRMGNTLGKFILSNLTNPSSYVYIDSPSIDLTVDASCTAGAVVIMGVGALTDNSGPGCTVVSTNLLNPDTIAKQVWTETTVQDIVDGVWTDEEIRTKLLEIYALHGLDPTKPLIVTDIKRTAGAGIDQSIVSTDIQVTVTRQ